MVEVVMRRSVVTSIFRAVLGCGEKRSQSFALRTFHVLN
jgi:hypothetical protein